MSFTTVTTINSILDYCYGPIGTSVFTASPAAREINSIYFGVEEAASESIVTLAPSEPLVEPASTITQEAIKKEVADLYERYVELGLEIQMNEIYREVYLAHGLLEAYETWKATPSKLRKTKSFVSSLAP
jgi:hypothetical protein